MLEGRDRQCKLANTEKQSRLSSSGLASPSPNVLQEMLTKHPQSPPPSLPTDPVPPPMVLSESIVSCSVRSFPVVPLPAPLVFE